MAALAYTLGKREINHYFSVRSAKALALAAVLLLVVVVTAVTYCRRHRQAKTDTGAGVDSGPLELEGVKACLENGDLSSHKAPENAVLSNPLECEVPLMQSHYPSNNNSTALKPSYF